jgi:hypothetical protein
MTKTSSTSGANAGNRSQAVPIAQLLAGRAGSRSAGICNKTPYDRWSMGSLAGYNHSTQVPPSHSTMPSSRKTNQPSMKADLMSNRAATAR